VAVNDTMRAVIGLATFVARLNGLPVPLVFEWRHVYVEGGPVWQRLTVF
jgi:hypothetical protein